MIDATDYNLTATEAGTMGALVMLPHDARTELLRRYLAEHGAEALVSMFSQAVGMANSVIANNREAIEMLGIIEGTLHPERSHNINLPTMAGAVAGTELARRAGTAGQKACHGCAYRLGSVANQSPSTTADAVWVRDVGEPFWCHEEMDERGKPTRKCRGHAAAARVRA